MGCHTWFYKKVERSIEEAREIWLKKHSQWISRWEEVVNNPEDDFRVSHTEYTQEDCERLLAVDKRRLVMVEKGLCSIAVMNKQPDDSNGYLYTYINGTLYCTDDDLPHDLFRIGKFPKDILLSYDETISFIETNKDKINVCDNWRDKIKAFWDAFPDGMIKFG